MRELLALACLASLCIRTERYPAIVEIASAVIRLQDILFAALLVVSSAALAAWAREQPLLAVSLATFLVLLFLSAVRSPAGVTAIVGAGRYVEFVVAGVAIALGIRSARPSFTTAVLAAGTAALALTAMGDLVQAGPRNLLHGRSGGLLPIETAAAAASFAIVWFVVRLQRLESMAERRFAIGGIVLAAIVLTGAKSVLAVGCVLAVVALLPLLRLRRLLPAIAIATAVLAVAAVGRSSDIASALGGDGAAVTRSAAPVRAQHGGEQMLLPQRYVRRAAPSPRGGSFVHRIALAYLGVRIAQDAPLLGYGWLATSDPGFLRNSRADLHMLERFPDLEPALLVSNMPASSHNAYLQTAAEVGLPATALLIAVLLLVLVPGLAALHRHRRVAPWQMACGVGWLVVLVVFLSSSTLFGGQLETAMLGVAVAFGSNPNRERVGPRRWLLAVLAVGALLVSALAALTQTTPQTEPPSLSRVVAAQAGHELLSEGTLAGSPASVELRNGLVRVRVHGDRLDLTAARAVSGRFGRATAHARLAELGRTHSVRLARRTADVATLEFLTSDDVPVAALTLVRGVAGVYVTDGSGARLTLPGMDSLITGRTRRRAMLDLRDVAPRRLGPGTPAVAIRKGPHGLGVVLVPLEPAAVAAHAGSIELSMASPGASFVGVYPFPSTDSSPRVGSLASGTYLAAPTSRGAGSHLLRSSTDPSRWDPVRAWIPFALDDTARSGVAELASLAFSYRAAPPHDLAGKQSR